MGSWEYGQRLLSAKDYPQLGLPTQGSERPSKRTFFLYLTVRANKSWCVTNCQMDSLLQIPQRKGGARLT